MRAMVVFRLFVPLLVAGTTLAQNTTSLKYRMFKDLKSRQLNEILRVQGQWSNPAVWLYTLDSTLEYVMDSVSLNWVYNEAESYSYDEQMRFNKQASYWHSSETGMFEPIEKDTIVFRPDGRIDTFYRYYGDVAKQKGSVWMLGDYDVYMYAPDTQTVVRYAGSMQSGFFPVNKYVDVFYPDGNLKETYYYEADSTGFLWPVNKREFVRSGGLLTEETGYVYYQPWNAWIYSDRTDYVYIGGLNVLTWRYTYDPTTMQWLNFEKDENTYDAEGRLTSRYTYHWDETSGTYVPSSGFTQSYTPNGDPDTLVNYVSYDQISFFPSERLINEYDAGLNPYRFTIWWYNYFSFQWEPIEMQEIEYYNPVTLEQMLWPPFIDSIYMRHQPENVYGYQWDGQSWQEYRYMRLFYHYREFTGLDNVALQGVAFWPNPFGSELHVEGKGNGVLELTSLNGSRVMVLPLHLPAVVNIQSLPAGVYVYRLQAGGNTYTGKLIRR